MGEHFGRHVPFNTEIYALVRPISTQLPDSPVKIQSDPRHPPTQNPPVAPRLLTVKPKSSSSVQCSPQPGSNGFSHLLPHSLCSSHVLIHQTCCCLRAFALAAPFPGMLFLYLPAWLSPSPSKTLLKCHLSREAYHDHSCRWYFPDPLFSVFPKQLLQNLTYSILYYFIY